MSFIVAENRQSDWIGTRLLERLADEAGRAAIERFVAEVLPENRAMLALASRVGAQPAGFDGRSVVYAVEVTR